MPVKEHITCYRDRTPAEWRSVIDQTHTGQMAAWTASILWYDFASARDAEETPGIGIAFDDLVWKYDIDEAKKLLAEDVIAGLEAIGYTQARARCAIKQDEWAMPSWRNNR
jgi:hypothetical protein